MAEKKQATWVGCFIPPMQRQSIKEGLRGEEKSYFLDLLSDLEQVTMAMPEVYQAEESEDPTAHLHYFKGGSDWWIIEKDLTEVQHQAFGFACLNGDTQNAEYGYISLPELFSVGAELDFHFTPTRMSAIKEAL